MEPVRKCQKFPSKEFLSSYTFSDKPLFLDSDTGERESERERERKRERESSLAGPAAGLSHLPEELEEVIAIGVCNMNRQHRGVGAEGRGDEHRLPRTKSC